MQLSHSVAIPGKIESAAPIVVHARSSEAAVLNFVDLNAFTAHEITMAGCIDNFIRAHIGILNICYTSSRGRTESTTGRLTVLKAATVFNSPLLGRIVTHRSLKRKAPRYPP